ncbi:sensor histidine kinase [Myceligenerans crystallogenes]|uniref:Signal transduction histidine kinase subgroup 3 dimerisation and phosphoacceptor domain-containing protein n=1 Tax=Myceligenerans crystallogenes TaxID=316335 RepID=A0ABN2NPM2_9MICO
MDTWSRSAADPVPGAGRVAGTRPSGTGAGPAVPDAGLTAFRRNVWWGLASTVACILGLIVGDWMLDPAVPLGARVVTGLAAAATIVISGVLLSARLRDEPPSRALVAGLAVAAAAGGIVPLAAGNFGMWSLVPAAALAVLVLFLPPRGAWTGLGAGAVVLPLAGAAAALAQGEPDVAHATWMPLLMVAAFGPAMLGMLRAWQVAARLEEARRLAGALAVADERLRFAAELHDVQGHHLQVIALKSELAARLADADPQRAAAEMREVQRLAGDALRETRAVVQGYRRTTLDAEITNASRVLAAAGVDARVAVDDAVAGRLAGSHRGLLGLVVREATTNILRHSHAAHATITLRDDAGRALLEITDDGAAPGRTGDDVAGPVGPAGTGGHAGSPAGQAPPGPERSGGTGLVSLGERLAVVGGTLTWERTGTGFAVAALVDPAAVAA